MEHSRKSAISSVLLVSMEVANRNWPSTSLKESWSKARRSDRGFRTRDWKDAELRVLKGRYRTGTPVGWGRSKAGHQENNWLKAPKIQVILDTLTCPLRKSMSNAYTQTCTRISVASTSWRIKVQSEKRESTYFHRKFSLKRFCLLVLFFLTSLAHPN